MRTRSLGLGNTTLEPTKLKVIGNQTLQGGTMDYGYYGTVTSSDLISGDELASLIGLTAGVSQYSNIEWLKFNSGGKIIYSPMKPIRHSITWNEIKAVNAIDGSRVVEIKGYRFKIRLWRGASVNPVNSYSGVEMQDSEWNKLMLPIHIKAKDKSWAEANSVENDVQYWGIDFTDEDLHTSRTYGTGTRAWVQERYAKNTTDAILRGGWDDVSSSSGYSASGRSDLMGYRPVLELVDIVIPQGNDLYGYYGKYKGIITPNELISLAGITQGTTKNDAYNNPNEDITWLKFSHNYKTLFTADRTIHYGVSWDHLNSKGLVFGKVVDIDGQKYLLRLLQGANVNPASVGGGANSNDEWDSLIVQFTPNTEDSHWHQSDLVNTNSANTICQETGVSISHYICRGGGLNKVSNFANNFSKGASWESLGYRPVLEVL